MAKCAKCGKGFEPREPWHRLCDACLPGAAATGTPADGVVGASRVGVAGRGDWSDVVGRDQRVWGITADRENGTGLGEFAEPRACCLGLFASSSDLFFKNSRVFGRRGGGQEVVEALVSSLAFGGGM